MCRSKADGGKRCGTYVSRASAASALGWSVKRVNRAVAEGELRVTATRRIPRAEVQRLAAEHAEAMARMDAFAAWQNEVGLTDDEPPTLTPPRQRGSWA